MPLCSKPGALDALADGHDDDIRRDAALARVSGVGPGPAAAPIHLADDLGLDPEGLDLAVLVGLDAGGGLEGQDLGPLGHGALHLLRQGGHILQTAAVDAGDLFGPQADGAAGHVHGDVAAADDDHLLPREVRHLIVPDVAQQLHGGDDTVRCPRPGMPVFLSVWAPMER